MKNFLLSGLIAFWATAAIAHSPLDETTLASPQASSGIMDMDLEGQAAFTKEFRLPMHDMGAGVYVIKWRGLGADGHALNGTFSFTVE